MQRKFKKIMFKAISILLVIFLTVPVVAFPVADAVAQDDEVVEVQGLVIPVATTGGITPAQLDEMAIDPQSWRLSPDLRHNPLYIHGNGQLIPYDGAIVSDDWEEMGDPAFIPHPVINWNRIREGDATYQPGHNFDALDPFFHPGRVLRGAIVLVEYADRPLISSLPQGSEIMGNPQVETNVYGLQGEARAAAIRDFWREFLNEYIPGLNRTHNVTGGWLEYTSGLWELDLSIYGPFMAPFFQFQYPPNTTWFSSPVFGAPTTAVQRAAFDDFTFQNIFGTSHMLGMVDSMGGTVPGGTAQALGPQAGAIAAANGVDFIDPVTGAPIYQFVFFTYAGYCQSPTWQEMGSMMFDSPYRRADGSPSPGPHHATFDHVLPTIADADEVLHPVTREVLINQATGEPVTGMDFTGYAHMWRMYNMITDPGFNLMERWAGLRLLDDEAMWKTYVSSGAHQAAFLAARAAHEGPNVTVPTSVDRSADGLPPLTVPGTDVQRTVGDLVMQRFIDAHAHLNAALINPVAWRDNIDRFAFITVYAEGLKYDPTPSPAPVTVFSAGELDDEEYALASDDENELDPQGPASFEDAPAFSAFSVGDEISAITEGEMVYVDGRYMLVFEEGFEPVVVLPEVMDAAIMSIRPPFQPFSPGTYSAMYQAWLLTRTPQAIEDHILDMIAQGKDAARNSLVNPYFQAANQRYVQWASWYGSANIWSHATSFILVHPLGARSISMSGQGEGTAMGVYSHELGHIVRLPDNDNMVYPLAAAAAGPGNVGEPLPVRALLGPWNIMARGAHVGYYGGHTRWNIPGIRGGSAGTGLMSRMRIGAGFTDLTVPRGTAAEIASTAGPRNWVRDDYENSLDVRYVPYTTFRAGPPVIDEVFGRNMPMNRGIVDYYGNELVGREAVIIQGLEFIDRTPGVHTPIYGATNALRWGNNLLGVDLDLTGADPANHLVGLPRHTNPLRQTIIDPDRWNWVRGGPSGGTVATEASGITFPLPVVHPGITAAQLPVHSGFAIDVIDRVGYDSFSPDHGVLISRIAHTNVVNAGGMDGGAIFLIDAHPGNSGMIQFFEADGQPYMFACDHHTHLSTAAFRAGLHNNPYYYRTEFPHRFLTPELHAQFGQGGQFFLPDQRPGYAGNTVNEWVDEHNEFHFYILARNNHRGVYGPFLSYEVAVRNTAPGAYEVGGELAITAIGEPSAAAPGNFSRQTFRITNTGGTASDIIRVTLDGDLAEPVMKRSPFCLGDNNDPTTWFMYEAHTKDQNVVIHNNLFAVAPDEVIYFDVFIRVPDNATGNFDTTDILDVVVASETTPNKKVSFIEDGDVLIPPTAVTIAGPASVLPGGSITLTATVAPAAADQAVTWSVAGHAGASISTGGVLSVTTAVPVGAQLTVTATATGTTVSGTRTVTVTAPPPPPPAGDITFGDGGAPRPSATIPNRNTTFNPAAGGDVTVNITLNGHSIIRVRYDGNNLVRGTDWTEDNGRLILRESFLRTLPAGTNTIHVHMSGGANLTFFVIVRDGAVQAPPAQQPPAQAPPTGPPVMRPQHAAGAVVTGTTSDNTLLIDGVSHVFPAVNIGGYNFLKLRDVAMILNDTPKSFSVGFNAATNTISITSGAPYVPVGGELTPLEGATQVAIASPQRLTVNGQTVDVAAFNIDGFNYFRLRDLAILLDFAIDFDDVTRVITLNLTVPYGTVPGVQQEPAVGNDDEEEDDDDDEDDIDDEDDDEDDEDDEE